MKKLLLATAIAALSVSAAQAAPTIYGKIMMTADYVDSELDFANPDLNRALGYSENGTQINSNASRIGFKGSEAMTANTDVIYQLEYGIDVDADDNQTFRNRDTFLGLKNKTFGEFRAGNNQSTTDYVNNVVTATDGFWDNLGTSVDDIEVATTTVYNPILDLNEEVVVGLDVPALNMADSRRVSNSIVWKAPQMAGVPLQFAAMYANDDDIRGDNNSGWGAALMFDQGTGITAGLAYDDDINIAGSIIRGTATVDLAKVANAGLPLTLGALYQEADFDFGDKKEKGYVLSADMGLTNFAKPASIYAQYNNTTNIAGIEDLDSSQIVVGGKYFYKPNMIVHAYAGQNDAELGNEVDSKIFAVGGGLEYKF
jgi:predicted porin